LSVGELKHVSCAWLLFAVAGDLSFVDDTGRMAAFKKDADAQLPFRRNFFRLLMDVHQNLRFV
jgi:hypothetical protein